MPHIHHWCGRYTTSIYIRYRCHTKCVYIYELFMIHDGNIYIAGGGTNHRSFVWLDCGWYVVVVIAFRILPLIWVIAFDSSLSKLRTYPSTDSKLFPILSRNENIALNLLHGFTWMAFYGLLECCRVINLCTCVCLCMIFRINKFTTNTLYPQIHLIRSTRIFFLFVHRSSDDFCRSTSLWLAFTFNAVVPSIESRIETYYSSSTYAAFECSK